MPAGGGRRRLIIHYMVPTLLPIQLKRNAEARKGQSKERAPGIGLEPMTGEISALGRRVQIVPARLYNNPMLAYRNDDGFAVLAKRGVAQHLVLGSS